MVLLTDSNHLSLMFILYWSENWINNFHIIIPIIDLLPTSLCFYTTTLLFNVMQHILIYDHIYNYAIRPSESVKPAGIECMHSSYSILG